MFESFAERTAFMNMDEDEESSEEGTCGEGWPVLMQSFSPDNMSYTVEETAGCSCEQIIELQDLGLGHTYHGCSISAMDDWVELVTP